MWHATLENVAIQNSISARPWKYSMSNTPDDHSKSFPEPAVALVSDLSLATVDQQFESVFQPALQRKQVTDEPAGEMA
jgi:hypothetical protein